MTAAMDMGVERAPPSVAPLPAGELVDAFLHLMADELDHPELWSGLGAHLDRDPDLAQAIHDRMVDEADGRLRKRLALLLILCYAAAGEAEYALEQIQPFAIDASQSPQVQGAVFHINSLLDPHNPKYDLRGKICDAPFQQLDVLERATHLCCASWLQTSAGDLSGTDWEGVWNSPTAQAIRASIHDGSYRYCNKTACPKIMAGDLHPAPALAASSPRWRDIIDEAVTVLDHGPQTVNLAYDRTCNLSCPSCRTERFAADEATRLRFEDMQEHRILPLLRGARTVFVTGSGDPFASKNFRRLMQQLTPEAYPDLGFQIMTNGMLFTPRQWESFPALHRRVRVLKISIDAATGPTHELLRRGASWPVMLENMAFAGRLTAQGQVDHYELVFTVQAENFREMGDAVRLAQEVGASGVYFARLTNWGTFSHAQYSDKAVFLPSHPDHAEFLHCMQDPRLRDRRVLLGDLEAFVAEPDEGRRRFAA